jgi:hypothetical protein
MKYVYCKTPSTVVCCVSVQMRDVYRETFKYHISLFYLPCSVLRVVLSHWSPKCAAQIARDPRMVPGGSVDTFL